MVWTHEICWRMGYLKEEEEVDPKKIFIKQVSSDASMQTNCELKVAVRDRDQCEGEL